jgi:hypothetical protein
MPSRQNCSNAQLEPKAVEVGAFNKHPSSRGLSPNERIKADKSLTLSFGNSVMKISSLKIKDLTSKEDK